jgi:hypothetical protein
MDNVYVKAVRTVQYYDEFSNPALIIWIGATNIRLFCIQKKRTI